MELFEVTENHIKLLKRMIVQWNDVEFGAPTIDPKRPYGNSDVINDIRKITKLKVKEFSDDDLVVLHAQMETVLQIAICNLSINPGTYVCKNYFDWKPLK